MQQLTAMHRLYPYTGLTVCATNEGNDLANTKSKLNKKEVSTGGAVLELSSTADRDTIELFILGYWRLWFNRNNIVHGSFGWDVTDIAAWISNFSNEFQLANEVTHKEILSQQPVWRPPQVAEASPVLGCSFVELLEAQGCLEGLQLALDVGIFGVVLEFDAAGVIKLFSNQIVPRTEMGAIMKDCLALTNLEGLVSTVVVRREANSVVHNLAQLALSLEGLVVWLDELPMDIVRLVHLDFFFFL
ncbi:hypothetical protein Q3G72_025046 [Acer saccharum]|nr:hypothetical protein Q3G72_025046 [Acer saccharum]